MGRYGALIVKRIDDKTVIPKSGNNQDVHQVSKLYFKIEKLCNSRDKIKQKTLLKDYK